MAKQQKCDCVRSIRYAENLKKDLCAECEDKNKKYEERISSLEKRITVFLVIIAVIATLVGKSMMDGASESMQSIQKLQKDAESAIETLPSEVEANESPKDINKSPSKIVPEIPSLNPMSQSNLGGTVLPDGFDPNSIITLSRPDGNVMEVINGSNKSAVMLPNPLLNYPQSPKYDFRGMNLVPTNDVLIIELPQPRQFEEDLPPNYYPIPSVGGILLFGIGLGFVPVRPRR
jgi:hypothetical protein